MKNYYDIIIIGAGPAGLSCALELEKSDYSVLLLEKEKQLARKACASGLTKKVKGFFDNADIVEKKFSAVSLFCGKTKRELKQASPFVATINKEKLLHTMAEKLDEVYFNQEVRAIKEGFIETSSKDKIGYKYLVGADGSNSIVRKSLGLKQKKFITAIEYYIKRPFQDLELIFEPRLFGSGYAWIFPHQNYTSVGCGASQKKYKKISRIILKAGLKKEG